MKEKLEKHLLWLNNKPDGICFSADNLQDANLQDANLQYANLQNANLQNANLQNANLQGAKLQDANLQYANLQYANLRDANLQYANLRDANLQGANLQYANLQGANLQYANLRDANLQYANLHNTNLSGCIGVKTAKDYFSTFEYCDEGIIVYKAIGKTFYYCPISWKIEKGKYITEVPNPSKTQECGCGVNFATLEWIKNNVQIDQVVIWKALIEWDDLADVIVPYNTDGKARCARLRLICPLEKGKESKR